MKRFAKVLEVAAMLLFATSVYAAPAPASAPMVLPDQVMGKSDAPIKVDEFVSFTCSHCAEFYNNVMPEIEKRYIDTGKVRFVLHDYVMDGPGLKAAELARCMPEEEFFPFVKVIYQNQADWMANPAPEKALLSYARLGGLSEDKAQACLKDTKLQDAIVAERDVADKYKIEATPTFVVNDGAETIKGAMPAADFAKVFDQLLAEKH